VSLPVSSHRFGFAPWGEFLKKKATRVRAWMTAAIGAALLGTSLVCGAGTANAADPSTPSWVIDHTITPGAVGGSGTVTFSTQTLYRETFSDPNCAPLERTAPNGTLTIDIGNSTSSFELIHYSPPLSQWPSTTSTATDPSITSCTTTSGTAVPATATVTRTVATWSLDYSCQSAGTAIVASFSDDPNTNPSLLWGGTWPWKVPDNGPLPACPAAALTTPSGPLGSPLTVTGSGFPPASTATLSFDTTTLSTATVAADGTVTLSGTVPSYATSDRHIVRVTAPGIGYRSMDFTLDPSVTFTQVLDAKAAQWGLGAPTGPITRTFFGCCQYRPYQYGAVIGSNGGPVFVSRGAIRAKWLAVGSELGPIGYPSADEVSGLPYGGVYQEYNSGAIVWSPATGAHVSSDDIWAHYSQLGIGTSVLGYPTSDVGWPLNNGGKYQLFQGGAIVWSPATGAHVSTGAIRTRYHQLGYETGVLGYPTTDEVGSLRGGGVDQLYQGGAIYWSPATGAHESTGAIRTRYAQLGYENGTMGYPTTNEVTGLKGSGVYQLYQGGAIVWSPTTGAHESTGPIRAAWQSAGFENGRLGYPTSDVYPVPNGTAQNFQGGKITNINRTTTIS
jgi:hypothetical protein